jgi:hypothetical protein
MEQSGEPRHFQPFGLLLKGFSIFTNYFPKKEGFLEFIIVYNIKI